MKVFALLLVAATVGFISADQPPLPDMETICELSRDPFIEFLDCMEEELPESVNNAVSKSLECLGMNSPLDLLNYICEKHAAGIDADEVLPELESCSPYQFFTEEPSVEDRQKEEKAFDRCFIRLMPYFEAALEKAAFKRNIVV